jgi:hypothetical protein
MKKETPQLNAGLMALLLVFERDPSLLHASDTAHA